MLEDPTKSYHAPHRVTDHDIFDNKLIFGDNLLTLKALEQDFTGKIKCIFIDPPCNTGSAFEHYDDGIEHSLWLSLMRERLVLLWRLLQEDGSIWITIDDNECHYLKVLCDELFGRASFVSSIAWEKDKGRRSDTDISSAHDHILLYAKDRVIWKKIRNPLPRTSGQEGRYRNPDKDPRGPWLQGDNATARSGSEESNYPITTPSGRVVTPSAGRYWAFSRETFTKALAENRVYFGKKGDGMPLLKRYLSEVQEGVVPRSWWPADEAGHNQEAKWGNLVINKEFNADMLSEAVCKLEGYIYAPSDTLYWQHGHSSEKSFIYVTTQHLTREQLTQLNDEVGSNRSLLVCCAAFRGKAEQYPNLELKKIPKAVLSKCEWGHDDYSLKIENLPKAPPKAGQQNLFGEGD